MYRLVKIGFILAIIATIGCTTGPSAEPDDDTVAASDEESEAIDQHPGVVVSPEWLEDRLNAPNLVILHVGDDEEAWQQAHIPGQVYIDFFDIVDGDFETGFWLPDLDELRRSFEDAGVDNENQIVITGNLEGLMATRAFFSLEVLGRTKGVALLDGGLAQWQKDERSVSQNPEEPTPGQLTTEASTQMVLEAADVMEILNDSSIQLVDARPPQEFSGAVAGDGVARPGHIPGAVNIFWKQSLLKDDRPLFRSHDEIAELYSRAGVDDDDTIVAYCRTGVQASFGYFLGRLQQRDSLIYDGSFIDWAADQDRPIETPNAEH